MRVLLSGGGTGGHIYPALSIAAALREKHPGVKLLYLGTKQGLEAELVPSAGIPFGAIQVSGLVRKSPLQFAGGLARLLQGLWQAWWAVRRFRPDVVVGTGGYVSGPVLAAAVLQRRPVLIQEQNAVPGVTNRILARFAACVAVAYPESEHRFPRGSRIVWTGNPVREELLQTAPDEAKQRLNLKKPLVLVFAGSRGSATINRLMMEVIAQLEQEQPEFTLWYASGEQHYSVLLQALSQKGIDPNRMVHVKIQPYLHQMPLVLAACDLVVGRAGAMAISEITAVGLPAVLIPSPYVTHHHQEKNAAVLEKAGAAVVLPESGLTADRLLSVMHEIMKDPERRQKMAAASRSHGRPDALPAIVEQVLKLGASR